MNKIEEKYGLTIGQVIALLIILILNLVWIISSTAYRIKTYGNLPLNQIANIVMFFVTVYYVCYSYKKPHGNLMRYLILACAALEAFQYANSIIIYPTYMNYVFYGVTMLKTYMAGRLDHYKQNVVISAIVLVCECLVIYNIISIMMTFNVENLFVYIIRIIGPVTLWLAIATSYIIRFKPHKEAGLED